MQQGAAGSGEKLLSLAPQGQYGKLQPHISVDPNTGEHIFSYPAQVDSKNIAANNEYKANQAAAGNDVDPTKLKAEIKAPAKTYRINPASPEYVAQAAQMAKEQNINLNQLNQIEGVKGGHGQIQQAQGVTQVAKPTQQSAPNQASLYQHVTKAKDANGNVVNLGYKNGKWFNTQTNKAVE
jgi:hypothetical protein